MKANQNTYSSQLPSIPWWNSTNFYKEISDHQHAKASEKKAKPHYLIFC